MIIGIAGNHNEVGKSTLASYLAQMNEPTTRLRVSPMPGRGGLVVGFAWELKELCAEQFPDLDFHTKPLPEKNRTILQRVGMTFRELDKWHWVKRLDWVWHKQVREFAQDAMRHLVLDDVRFPEEVDYIRALNGLLLKIELDPAPARTGGEHASVTALDTFAGWDGVYTRTPTSTIEEMKCWARDVLCGHPKMHACLVTQNWNQLTQTIHGRRDVL